MRVSSFLVDSWRENRLLVCAIGFSLLCLVISTGGLAFNYKEIAGEHAWIKPFKFSISLAVYSFTLLWYSRFLTNHPRLIKRISVASFAGTVVELSVIITQVLRGEASHFNTSTAFNHTMFVLAVCAIMPLAVSTVLLFVHVLRERQLPPVIRVTLSWALLVTIVGFLPGVIMLLPGSIPGGLANHQIFDGHTIGYPDGGPGIPYLGWSTVAGDLRVAHFVGIHALQLIPLFGLLISQLFPLLNSQKQKSLVSIFSLCYLSMILLLTVQALGAESCFSPGLGMKVLMFSLVSIGALGSAYVVGFSLRLQTYRQAFRRIE